MKANWQTTKVMRIARAVFWCKDQQLWEHGQRSGAKNRNGIKDDWGDWVNSARKEGTDKGYKSASGRYGDTYLDIWMRSMDSASKAQGTNGGYTDDGVKKDRGGYQIGHRAECGAQGQIEAEGSVGYGEEVAAELETKDIVEMSTNRVTIKKIYNGEIPGRRSRKTKEEMRL